MLQSMESEEFGRFVRVDGAVKLFSRTIIPVVSAITETWHKDTSLQIGKCPVKDKQCDRECNVCIAWGQAIEEVFYAPPTDSTTALKWSKVNLRRLQNSPLEVAKFFAAGNLPHGISEYGDFDAASLLTIMMSFKEINRGDFTCYNLLKQVSRSSRPDINNYL